MSAILPPPSAKPPLAPPVRSSSSTTTNPIHAMVAGYLAGSSGTIVGYPLDSLKVWIQTNTLGKNSHLHHTHAPPRRVRVASNLLARGAGVVRALYSGVTGPLLTVGAVQSVNFCTYDATRRFLYRLKHPACPNPSEYLTKDPLWHVALSGACGGFSTAILTAPLLMIKLHQQTTGRGVTGAAGDLLRGGLLGRAYGPAFWPHALSESLGRCIYVGSYEFFKRSLVGRGGDAQQPLSLGERMLCAAGSGISCWGCFFPLDALRNRMYHAAVAGGSGGTSVLATLRAMRSERAFYRGFSISIVRAGPVAASVLPVYDLTLERLSSWNGTFHGAP